MLTDSEILENRKKVVAFLQQPHLKKFTGWLGTEHDLNARCCLGHMCAAMGYEPETFDGRIGYKGRSADAPAELMEALGMHTPLGMSKTGNLVPYVFASLSSLNDVSQMTTQDIGRYLEKVIMGGDNTPWRKLNVD